MIIIKDNSYQTKGEVKLRIVEGKSEEFVRLLDIGDYIQQVYYLFSRFFEQIFCLLFFGHLFCINLLLMMTDKREKDKIEA
jgi:hypothetical protein